MALIDLFIRYHAKPRFRGCPFINAAAELPDVIHPARSIINDHKVWLRNLLVRLATADGLDNKITNEKIVKDSLQPGITHTMTYQVPDNRTVPKLLPEAPEVVAMPEVLATGYVVGIIELACMQALRGRLDEDEITLGTQVNFSHAAPTVPGSTVTIDVKVLAVDRRALTFEIEARDEHATISTGTHQRGVVNRERFESRLNR